MHSHQQFSNPQKCHKELLIFAELQPQLNSLVVSDVSWVHQRSPTQNHIQNFD